MPHLADVNEVRNTATHYCVPLIRVVPLPSIMRKHDPVSMPTHDWNEIGIGGIGCEVFAVPRYTVSRVLEGVRDEIP